MRTRKNHQGKKFLLFLAPLPGIQNIALDDKLFFVFNPRIALSYICRNYSSSYLIIIFVILFYTILKILLVYRIYIVGN
ncbi:MAG: hypothetical protein CVU39_10695 [Chloroflexi bacterium HGW-Chloroflexi-10]|nr:MAG: hypothetical protein CVU39_10695 [Chloroflexi bacterium HGW-Chloroflexi-10]